MPRIIIHVGGREPLRTTISKGTPLGLLSTNAIVDVELLQDLTRQRVGLAGHGDREVSDIDEAS